MSVDVRNRRCSVIIETIVIITSSREHGFYIPKTGRVPYLGNINQYRLAGPRVNIKAVFDRDPYTNETASLYWYGPQVSSYAKIIQIVTKIFRCVLIISRRLLLVIPTGLTASIFYYLYLNSFNIAISQDYINCLVGWCLSLHCLSAQYSDSILHKLSVRTL